MRYVTAFYSKLLLNLSTEEGWGTDSIDFSCLQIQANLILFIGTNIAGVLTHYPSEIAQRQAFMETRQCIQARLTTQKENQQQVNYVLTLILFNGVVSDCFNTLEIGLDFSIQHFWSYGIVSMHLKLYWQCKKRTSNR